MITTIASFLGLKTGLTKWILAGLAALAIIATISGGYMYVNGLHREIVEVNIRLSKEKTAREIAQKSELLLRSEIQRQADAMERLNLDLAESRKVWADKHTELDQMDTKDARAFADHLNSLSRDLNRMLERSSTIRP